MKKNTKASILIILLALIIAIVFYVFERYGHFVKYKSEENLIKIETILSFLDGFKVEFGYLPDQSEFFDYIQSDSSVLYINFPDFHFPDIDPKDFVIRSNNDFIYVWLFSESKAQKDTAFIKDMSFLDFILRRSHLVAQYSFPDPCRPEMIYFEKNNVSIKNEILYKRIWKVISEIHDWQQERLHEHEADILCCYHIYIIEHELIIEPISFKKNNCTLDNEMHNHLKKELQFLMDEYAEYDFYIQFFLKKMN